MPRIVNLANLSQFAATSLSDGGYMPGPRIIPNACKVQINWSLNDVKTAHNVYYANYTGTPALSPTVAETIRAGLVAGAGWTNLALFLTTGCSLTGVTVTDMRSTLATDFLSTGAATPGTSVSTALPDESAAVITLRTGLKGPSGRGRLYIPGWASNAVGAAGVIAPLAVTALGAWANTNLYANIASAIGAGVIGHVHRREYTSAVTGRHFDDRPAGTVPIVTVLVRDNHWDSQRKRGLK
jgi:hypothetical protein